MPELSAKYLETELKNLCPNFRDKKFLLALSGGVDSMVLGHLFLETGLTFDVAHVNYHLREQDSNRDQKLIESFCSTNKKKLHIYDVTEKDKKPENSIELWAREIRYNFFFKTLIKYNLDFLITAHHLNDQLETFIINLSKAAGISGLCGIPNNKNKILRPLLHITKKQIYTFAHCNNIIFGEDCTNNSNDFLRNRIRNNISPEIEKVNACFWENFDKSISHLNLAKNFIYEQINKILTEIIISQNENEIILDKEKLSIQSEFVKYEILKRYNFLSPIEQKKIFSAQNGSIFKGKTLKLLVKKKQLILSPKNSI